MGEGLYTLDARGLVTYMNPAEAPSKPGPADAESSRPSGAAAAEPPGAEKQEGGYTMRVLLVDDHQMAREGLASLLGQEADVEVVGQASDGYEAVELARRLQPDVVTMDVTMPRMNGIEATRHIKSELPQVRVIRLSMHGDLEQGAAMRQAGADAYLNKGGPSEELLLTIRRFAGHEDGPNRSSRPVVIK